MRRLCAVISLETSDIMFAQGIQVSEKDNQRRCGCKGVRSCAVCENERLVSKESHVGDHAGEHSSGPVLWFCADCWKSYTSLSQEVVVQSCAEHVNSDQIAPRGVHVFRDFISDEEEAHIVDAIDSNPWKLSQSGRKKQDYGPRPNFKKRRVKVGSFCGLPPFSEALLGRMRTDEKYGLSAYEPVEQCHLDYSPDRGSAIDPHRDDTWLWGEQLVTVNLLADSVLTFTLEEKDADLLPGLSASAGGRRGDEEAVAIDPGSSMLCEAEDPSLATAGGGSNATPLTRHDHPHPAAAAAEMVGGAASGHDHSATTRAVCTVYVPMPRRSLVVVDGEARHRWLHAVRRSDITARRIAITYRNLGPDFCDGGGLADVGNQLRLLAKNFNGVQTT